MPSKRAKKPPSNPDDPLDGLEDLLDEEDLSSEGDDTGEEENLDIDDFELSPEEEAELAAALGDAPAVGEGSAAGDGSEGTVAEVWAPEAGGPEAEVGENAAEPAEPAETGELTPSGDLEGGAGALQGDEFEPGGEGDFGDLDIPPEISQRQHQMAQVEAALFVSQNPVSIEELSVKLEIGKVVTKELVTELAMDYMDRITSLEIVQIGPDKFTMQIKPEFTDRVKRFAEGGLIPEAIMRTLTIIALKQPLLKSLLVKLRGSGAYEHTKDLLSRGLVKAVKKGRSQELTTTDQFADMFGLSRDVNKLKAQLKTQLGVTDEEEDTTPPPPPAVPDV